MIKLGQANEVPFERHMMFEHENIRHSVFIKGAGPGVVLMHELPGMTPEFWRLANWLSEHFTIFAPDLFGKSDKPTPARMGILTIRACISREIHLFSQNDPGPITQWLRALSKELHLKTGERGIGVIGMCMTGNFALTLALDPWVVAPVSSQPGIPASTLFRNQDGGLQMTDEERAQLADADIDIMALRFEGDKLCRAARFDTIRSVIGKKRLLEHVIADEHRNPNGPLKHPHSVLTADLINEKDSVTKGKLIQVIGFLNDRIKN